MRTAVSKGQSNYQRAFVRVDTGKFGPSDAKAFISYSTKLQGDKFKGPGEANREHIDFAAEDSPPMPTSFRVPAFCATKRSTTTSAH
jgi:hypothetical protein